MSQVVSTFGVYVAAAATAEEMPRVRAVIAMLQAKGIRVTCTWPEVIAIVGAANPRDATHDDRRGWATQDLAEIDASDALLFLVPDPPMTTRGAWWEASHAHDTNKHLVFSGDTRQSILCSLGIEFMSDAGAVEHIARLALAKQLATSGIGI